MRFLFPRPAASPSRPLLVLFALILLVSSVAGCKTDAASNSSADQAPPAQAKPERRPSKDTQSGLAVFLHEGFQGKATASGEMFDHEKLLAAHPSYPLGTIVRITNVANDREVEVRIVDRGPSESDLKRGIIIDLSRAAAEGLEFVKQGRAKVRTEVIEWGNKN